MGLDDKIKNAAQDVSGKAKETAGKHGDDEKLQREGEGDQKKASLKNAGENVKDAFK
ncbi:CsbD family protein [Labedella endophytica]|uniref:CsbD family protein n=1 Tax=Labedella endophytica TaxID=1523160 RepID=A0A3S0Y2Z1_9MICO|nr:CsbD family protein [Labedella endophytica]RUR03554.1 CsbD family protein [Labedella endophytica]